MSLPNENLAGPCDFHLWISDPSTTLDATWITYDRGLDISNYYGDPDVRAFAKKHRIALMMPHQCPAKTPATGEMDMDLSHGIAPTIFASLKNFAQQSGHNDLSDSKLILLDFRERVLFARFVAYLPDRVVAAILTAPGQGDPFGIEKVDLPGDALHVPELIVVGGSEHWTVRIGLLSSQFWHPTSRTGSIRLTR